MTPTNDMNPMDDLTPLLHDLIDGRLPPDESRALEERIAADDDLRRRYAELRSIVSGLREFRNERAPAGFSDRVLREIAKVDEDRAPAARASAPLRLVSRYGSLAAACVAVLTVGILLSSRFDDRGSWSTLEAPRSAAEEGAVERTYVKGDAAAPNDEVSARARDLRLEPGASDAESNEIAEAETETKEDQFDSGYAKAARVRQEAPSRPGEGLVTGGSAPTEPSDESERSAGPVAPVARAKGVEPDEAGRREQLESKDAGESGAAVAAKLRDGSADDDDAAEGADDGADGGPPPTRSRLVELLQRLTEGDLPAVEAPAISDGKAEPPLRSEVGRASGGAKKQGEGAPEADVLFAVVRVTPRVAGEAGKAERSDEDVPPWEDLLANVSYRRLNSEELAARLPPDGRALAAQVVGGAADRLRVLEIDEVDLTRLLGNAAAAGLSLDGLDSVPGVAALADAPSPGLVSGAPESRAPEEEAIDPGRVTAAGPTSLPVTPPSPDLSKSKDRSKRGAGERAKEGADKAAPGESQPASPPRRILIVLWDRR